MKNPSNRPRDPAFLCDHANMPEPWEEDAETDKIVEGAVPIALVGVGTMIIMGALTLGAFLWWWKQ